MYKLVGKGFWLERRKAHTHQQWGSGVEFHFYNSSKKQTAQKLGFVWCLEGAMMRPLVIDGAWTWQLFLCSCFIMGSSQFPLWGLLV